MIVLIDGYYASGKTTLWGLLDGTPGVFISPVQDDIINGFARIPELDVILKNKDLIGLRKLLINYTNFYILEHYAQVGRLNFHPSVDDISYHDFEFNFLDYERNLFMNLGEMEEWTSEEIITMIYHTMPRFWENYQKVQNDFSIYVTWGMHHLEGTKLLLDQFNDSSVISLRRPVHDVFATRLNRKPIADNFRSAYRSSVDFWGYLKRGEVGNVVSRNRGIDALQEKFPNRVLVVQLDEIVTNTEIAMGPICSLLGLKCDENHLHYSVNGEVLNDDFQNKFLGQVNDTSNLLSDAERMVISLEAGETVGLSVIIRNINFFLKWVWLLKFKKLFRIPKKFLKRMLCG